MGVRGLETFIANNCPNAFVPANIATYAENYREYTKREPVLLVDGFSFSTYLYRSLRSDDIHFCQYEEFKEQLKLIIRAFTAKNIELIFFFNGAPLEGKHEDIWKARRLKETGIISEGINLLRKKRNYDALELMSDSLAKSAVVKFALLILRHEKCKIVQMVKDEADFGIRQFIAKNNCFGILAQNSNFIITEGIENYFSVQDLHLRSLNTKVYRRTALAEGLGLHVSQLPLFATLCGGVDFMVEELRDFHSFLLRGHPDYKIFVKLKSLPTRLVIPNVAKWIGRNYTKFSTTSVAQLIGKPSLEQKIQELVQTYSLAVATESHAVEPVEGEWSEIIKVAEARHSQALAHRSILSVLTRLKYFPTCCIEMYDSAAFPSSGILLKELRRRFYGILLKERPTELGDPVVIELLLTGPDTFNPAPTALPEFPLEHPGLLRLWSDCEVKERLKLFCWAISESLTVEAVLSLPQSLRIACVSLFYLVNEVRSGLQRCEVEALVTHLLRLQDMSVNDLKKLKCEASAYDVIQVHIGSIYKRTWITVYAIDDACGNPLGSSEDEVFFDGKLFNNVYKSVVDGNEGSHQFNNVLFGDIIKFLYC